MLAGSAVWVYVALLPVMARDVLDGGALLLGVLSTSVGLGQIPAALLLAFYRDYPWAGRSYIAAMFVLGVAIVGYAYSTSVPLTLAPLAVTGFAFSAQSILLNAMLLRLVEPRFYGRVIGAMSLTWGVNVVGLVTAGILVETFGVELAVGLSGAMLVVCALGAALAQPQPAAALTGSRDGQRSKPKARA